MPLVVGVTGGIGSGKSALTDRLAQHNIAIVDADQAARIIVEPGQPALEEIAARFGSEILLADGALNRAALRQIVFEDADARRDLEAITHPKIRDELIRQLDAANSPYVILSSPLLLESGQVEMVDKVVVVDVPEAVQVQRTMQRDGNDEALVKRILAAQISREKRLAAADIVIDNTGELADLQRAADELHQQLLAETL
jgi:dephospho-CoA kinase